MKKIWPDILCAICWLVCGTIYLVRCLQGAFDPAWMGWTCMALEYACAGMWSLIAYKNYQIYKER